MAVAVDWLDAYRAESIEDLMFLYEDQAAHACDCDGSAFIVGKQALRAHWIERFKIHPAYDLADIQPDADGVTISYVTNCCTVQAKLQFGETGKIRLVICGEETLPLKAGCCSSKADAATRTYRVFPVDSDGYVVGSPIEIAYTGDREALAQAKQHTNGSEAEVWQGPRRVRPIRPLSITAGSLN